jgi:hypothetical protein
MTSTAAGGIRPESAARPFARSAFAQLDLALVPLAAFIVYWASSFILEAAEATVHFGSDAPMYAWFVRGEPIDRLTRFHPTTVVMELGWMKLTSPLAAWIAPPNLLKAMFAAVGAAGVWAAMWAFAAVVPRRYVALFAVIYAASLGVWYFSSIEESKIVTAALSAVYIAIYLHLRERWTVRGAVLLTAVLLLACLNEIVAGFLVAIPAVDALLRKGWNLRELRWVAGHALTAPLALVLLEGVVNGHLVAASSDPEGASHLSNSGTTRHPTSGTHGRSIISWRTGSSSTLLRRRRNCRTFFRIGLRTSISIRTFRTIFPRRCRRSSSSCSASC